MKKKMIKIGIISACCTLAMSTVALAAVPVIGGYLSRGVDSMCYYVDSTASSYTSYINTGINRWTNSGYSPSDFINMTAVSLNYATDVDYYAQGMDDFIIVSCLAETTYFSSTGSETSGVRPYYYSEIRINNDTIGSCTSYEKIGTMAHELGHAPGLDENNTNTSSIMCQLGSGRTVNTVSAEDYATVVSIYGGE